MKIAVASGKGGTGKTTVSINLYHFLAKYFNKSVQLVDCDVEEPNDALFFQKSTKKKIKQVFQVIPEINTEQCTFCKKCSDWCEFNAISVIKTMQFAEINPDLCHSCGACLSACNFEAITETKQTLGTISKIDSGDGNSILEGRLKIGSSMQTMLIKEVKKESGGKADISIYDAPPGTSCPVVETVADADYIIMVTEPTPFGLYDLKITLEVLIQLGKPFGVVVNKANLGNRDVYTFLNENNIELLGEIPFSKEYAENYANGNILENIPFEIENTYRNIIEKLELKLIIL